MIRSFETTAEQDAALAWRVTELSTSPVPVSEDDLIAKFAETALQDLVATYRRVEAQRVADQYQSATLDQRARIKAVLAAK